MHAVTMPTKKPKRSPRPPANALEEFSREAERALLRSTLTACGFSLSETARALGMVGPSGIPQAGTVSRKVDDLGLRGWFDSQRVK